MDEPVKIVNGNSNPDLISGDVAIEFRNATFAYPSKESVHVLKNINFKVYKG